jgi:hypothetical protein
VLRQPSPDPLAEPQPIAPRSAASFNGSCFRPGPRHAGAISHRICTGRVRNNPRHFLNSVLSNCTWKDGQLTATYRQPFDLLAEVREVRVRLALLHSLTQFFLRVPSDHERNRFIGWSNCSNAGLTPKQQL